MAQTVSPSVKVAISLPEELVARLNAIADSRAIGLSTLIRMLLLASLEKPAG